MSLDERKKLTIDFLHLPRNECDEDYPGKTPSPLIHCEIELYDPATNSAPGMLGEASVASKNLAKANKSREDHADDSNDDDEDDDEADDDDVEDEDMKSVDMDDEGEDLIEEE